MGSSASSSREENNKHFPVFLAFLLRSISASFFVWDWFIGIVMVLWCYCELPTNVLLLIPYNPLSAVNVLSL